MKLYQKFNLENFKEMQSAIYNKYRDQFYSNDGFFSFTVPWTEENFPHLYLALNNIVTHPVRLARFFITPGHTKQGIHIDGTKYMLNRYALNVPIYAESEKHYHIWYSNTDVGNQKTDSVLTDYILYSGKEPPSELDRVCIDMPTIVQTGIYHHAVNETKNKRIILSIRFNDNLKPNGPNDIININKVKLENV